MGFVYDYLGRRVEKLVQTWTDDTPDDLWVATSSTRFVYDGWLLLEELDVDSEGDVAGVRRQYTWGLDLAGLNGSINDRTSAGGIGGLLAMYDTMGTTTGENPTADDESYYYCYDANGNVGQVLDASDGSIAVKYEYDPYGNRVNEPSGGELEQPFRFSTKYFDAHTAMYYYGYRYYLPGIGRWGSRDPIGTHDHPHLYSFARAAAVYLIDPLGLCSYRLGFRPVCPPPPFIDGGYPDTPGHNPPSTSGGNDTTSSLQQCCVPCCNKCAVIVVRGAESEGGLLLAMEIANDNGCDLTIISTAEQLRHQFEELGYCHIMVISHGTDISDSKKPKRRKPLWPFGPSYNDEFPGLVGDEGFFVEPRDVARWKKHPCLRSVELYACYQGFGKRAQEWQDAIGKTIAVETHPETCRPRLRWIFEW